MSRDIVAARDGVALAELSAADLEWIRANGDGAYGVDPDDRPAPHMTFPVHRFAVVDAETGDLIGDVNWHATGYGPTLSCGAWNVGFGLLPAARGRGRDRRRCGC